jgi:tetratricopeptide (TPR) repeat protein
MALQGGFGSADQPLEEWFASLAPAAGTTEVNSSHSEIESLPLIDVLTRGSESRRQAVVALVARHFRPPLAPVLRRALDDPSNAVRVQAATALARIESTFLRSALDLAAAHSAAPGDVSLYLAQARLNDEHAHTGLLDAVREAESRGRALQWYERYLEAVPGDNEARTAMARLLIRQRRYEDASRVLEQLAEGSSPPGDVLAWRLEAAFHLGQWDRVRLWARQWNGRCQDDAEIPIEMRQAVALWAGGAA